MKISELTPEPRRGVLETYGECAKSAESASVQLLFNPNVVSDRLDFTTQQLDPDLQKSPVVIEFVRAIKRSTIQVNKSVKLYGRQVETVADPGPPKDLDEWDFKSFATSVRKIIFEHARNKTLISGQNCNGDQQEMTVTFGEAFIAYFRAYYEGTYVDRFGNTLAKPALSSTITNAEIAGVLQVFVELILDAGLMTPVWQDAGGKYYPGGSGEAGQSSLPTACLVGLATKLPLITDPKMCGITALKAEAIHYIANTSANKASMLGGLVGGSFGGLHFGVGILGKWSIGDNQTLQTIVTTASAKVFGRIGEEVSWRVLYVIPYNKDDTLAVLIQKFLDSQSYTGGNM